MAVATYNATVNADVVNIWRTVQTSVHQGFQFMSEEWEQLDFLKRFKVDVSLRSITVPIDITEDFGIASIAEGAYEARPSSPNVQNLALSIILLNGRFTVSNTAHCVEQHSAHSMPATPMTSQAVKNIQRKGRTHADARRSRNEPTRRRQARVEHVGVVTGGRVSRILLWEKHPVVIGAGLVVVLILLLMLRRLLFAGRRTKQAA